MSKVPAGIRANDICGMLAETTASLPEDDEFDRAAFARVPPHEASASATTLVRLMTASSRATRFTAGASILGVTLMERSIGLAPMDLDADLFPAQESRASRE